MPEFLPFRGVRYAAADRLDRLTAPPYDVIDADERALLAARDVHNSVQLILPEAVDDADCYEYAARLLTSWRADGTLRRDDEPAFYGYRMAFSGPDGAARVTHGVIGALGLGDEGAPVLPHERTLAKAASDRLALLEATRANFDPIWTLTLATGVARIVGEPGQDVAEAIDPGGVRHTVWMITDPVQVDGISALVAGAPMVLADGHHRYQTARTFRAAHPGAPGSDQIMALVVELAPEELWVQPIHRLATGVGPGLVGALGPTFDTIDVGANDPEQLAALSAAMTEHDGIGLATPDRLFCLVAREGALTPLLSDEPAAIAAIDSVRFDVGIRPHLGDARLAYRHDAAVVAGLVAKGAADVAFLLRPASVEEIRAAAFAGVRMPEKTTFFAPKPRTGMVFRCLDRA